MNGLKQEFEDQLIVIRVDVQSKAGKQLTSEYGSRVTPTFIFFDENGTEVWRRFGSINADQVRAELVAK